MAANEFKVRKIAGACGAEIEGVNLSQELDGEVVEAIRRAWLDHLVIVFRGQDLTPAQFMRFAERLGEPIEYPMLSGLEGFPRITVVAKLEHERQNFGGVWHSDTAYLEKPPMGTMLLAREVPPHGGDTLFANQYLAYETLSAGMKRLLDGLIAVNDSALSDPYRYQEDTGPNSPHRGARKRLIAEHPAVRTHPETGRKALYVNIGHTIRFKDMTVEESAPILKFLFQHQIQAEFTCRFSWQPGSLAFWDNRAAQHYPINDYHGFRRIMHRITLAGDTPC
jgi:taurine dioxygenase